MSTGELISSALESDIIFGENTGANSRKLCASSPTDTFAAQIAKITFDAPVFTTAGALKSAYDTAIEGAHAAARKKFGAEADLILYFAEIQAYTSERGANAHLRKAAGIPAGFEQAYEEFRKQYDIEYAFRTIQHKIQQLRGGCGHCALLNGDHKKSCPVFKSDQTDDAKDANVLDGVANYVQTKGNNGNGRPKINMAEARNAFWADRYMAMVGLLTNAPKDATPELIFQTMQQEAIAAHMDMDPEIARRIKVPQLIQTGDKDEIIATPSPDRADPFAYFDHLRAEKKNFVFELAAMVVELCDSTDAEEIAKAFPKEVKQQLAEKRKNSIKTMKE